MDSEESLMKDCNAIQFSSAVPQLCNEMDKIINLLAIAQKNDFDLQIYEAKVRSGIMRLRMLNAASEADFYEGEISRIKIEKSAKEKYQNKIFLYSLVGLALIAVFGSYVLNEHFRLYKKGFEYLRQLF